MDLSAEAQPFFSFDFQSRYARPTSTVLVPPTSFGEIAPKRPVNNTTTTCVINGVPVAMRSLTIDIGNNVVHENLPTKDEVFITNREVTGQISFTAQDITDHDFYADVESHSSGAQTFPLQIIHSNDGTVGTPGQSVQIDAPNVQFASLSESNENDLLVHTMELRILPGALFNDELTITLV